MTLATKVLQAFEGQTFGQPVAASEIQLAEKELGYSLPQVLRDLYSAFDGFTGPTNAPFFFPLRTASSFSQESLVSYTLFLRSEDYFPEALHDAVAVGDFGGGSSWFIKASSPEQVLRWDAEWGDEYEALEGSLLEIWLAEKAVYESIDPSV
jgi:SMI1 / KNR4 family (SUKH-1)